MDGMTVREWRLVRLRAMSLKQLCSAETIAVRAGNYGWAEEIRREIAERVIGGGESVEG